MEIHFSPFAFLLSLSLFIFMLLKLATTKTNHQRHLNLPPGPLKFPFIGNLHILAASSRLPHHTLRDLAAKYGPVMHLQLGEIPTVVISSPESAKEVMRTQDLSFASRPSILAAETLLYGSTDIAFSPYGPYWRQMRKIATQELLSPKRVQSFKHIREAEFLNLCKWIASNEGCSINLTEKIISTKYDIVSRLSLGEKTNEQAAFVSVLTEVVEVFSGFYVSDLYPSMKWMSMINGLKPRLDRLHKESDRILEQIIQQRILMRAVGDGNHEEDLLDLLLKLQDDDDLELSLTMDNVKAVILAIFFGGSETSSTTTDWAMSEMLKNPEVMKKVQYEVRQLFDGKGGCVDESSFDELNYLKSVIKETLRLHPSLPLLLPRECRETCEISGYNIPLKTRVMVNAWAIGRDPKYWGPDAESFVPERFMEDSSSVDFMGNDFQYIPFGAGRRICPGISYGLANVETQLALFLYHFDWSLPGEMKREEIDMTEAFGATARRKNKLYVVPTVMRPLPV